MPYSIPRPIPSKHSHNPQSERDRYSGHYSSSSNNTSSNTAGSAPVSFSPTKSQAQQAFRRRSSTIKSALSSLLGSSPPPQHSQTYHQLHRSNISSSLPKNTSSLSIGGLSSQTNYSSIPSDLRRYSSTAVEPMTMAFRSNSVSEDNNAIGQEDEDAVVGFYNDDNSLGDGSTVGASTSESSMSNPCDVGQSLKSFGKSYLTEYLAERGLLTPVTVIANQNIRMAVATSGDSVFLPTMSSNDDEYLARLNGLRNGEEEAEDLDEHQNTDVENTNTSPIVSGEGNFVERGPISAAPNHSESEVRENNDRRVSSSNREDDSADNRSMTSTGTAFEIDGSMATYTIAVILSLNQPTMLSSIKAELCSRVRVYWPNGVPPTKTFHEEFYCAGYIDWDLNLENMNLYVPTNVSSKERIINNNRNLRTMEIFQNSTESRKNYLDKNKSKKQLLKKIRSKSELYQPGDYVFIIPVVFSNSIPESLYLPSARVNYRFRVGTKVTDPLDQQDGAPDNQEAAAAKSAELESTSPKKFTLFKKLKNNLHLTSPHVAKEDYDNPNDLYGEYPINIVRTPPQYSISTANKPVYINRVWSDSLSYEISFAQKYVPLDSKVPIRIKIAPLVKNICLKRVRVSIVEKITLVSKNCEYEYDQIDPVAKDPYNPYYAEFASKRKKERNVSLLEIRTKEKGSRAIREEIVENCINDNLLAYTFLKNDEGEDSLGITEPLIITTNLEFPKYIDMDRSTARVVPPYGIDIYSALSNPETYAHGNSGNRGGVIGFLAGRKNSLTGTKGGEQVQDPLSEHHIIDSRFHETHFQSDSGIPIEFQTRLNVAKRGLYLDSLHFSNIYSRHKLEIMLRISKPDAKDPSKLRHYEVLIDTPIFLVSDLCNNGNMELPTYDMATNDRFSHEMIAGAAPPTFEEAISIPASPIASPVGSPRLRNNYDSDDLYINKLSLSRSASLSGASPLDGASTGSTSMALSSSVDANQRYNNLDHLLSSSSAANSSECPGGFTSSFKNIVEENESPTSNGNPSLFKRDYSISTQASAISTPHGAPPDNHRNMSGHLAVGFSHDPPSYEEILPLMSDEE